MTDYISRKSAIKAICVAKCGKHHFLCEPKCDTVAVLEEIPAADVVEVVRCRECFYYHPETRYCENEGCEWDPSGFCSDGERKDGADNAAAEAALGRSESNGN